MKTISMLLLFFYPTFVFAEGDPAVFLKKLQPAPYEGYLINEDTANKMYKINYNYNILEKKYNIDEQIIANKGEQIDELSKDNQQMAKSLAEIESRNKTTLIYTITGTAIGVIMLTFVAALAIKAVNDAAVKSPNIANVHSSAMPLVRF